MSYNSTVFATFVSDETDRFCTRLLIDSLREYGGTMSNCLFWVFSTNQKDLEKEFLSLENMDFYSFQENNIGTQYFFADKVRAWARAEVLAGQQFDTLVWIDPVCMVANPPLLLTLNDEIQAAFRPVHIRNIGQLFGQDLDQFWRSIFFQCKTPETLFPVIPFIDGQEIFPYFNTHCFSIAPKMGVLAKTLNHLSILNNNSEFMKAYCSDVPHKVFLFQAVLAATLLKEVPEKRIRLLPPDYSYPLHLIDQIFPEKAINKIDDLSVMVYEEKSIFEKSVLKLEISSTRRQWLNRYINLQ